MIQEKYEEQKLSLPYEKEQFEKVAEYIEKSTIYNQSMQIKYDDLTQHIKNQKEFILEFSTQLEEIVLNEMDKSPRTKWSEKRIEEEEENEDEEHSKIMQSLELSKMRVKNKVEGDHGKSKDLTDLSLYNLRTFNRLNILDIEHS